MIHPLADVHSTSIGSNTTIWQFAIVLKGAVIGENCNINAHTFIENEVQIGNSVTIKCGVYVWDGITIGDHVFVGPNVTFINDPYPRSKKHLSAYPQTLIGEGASIGAAATIKCGVTIGRFAMVGAASMLTKSIGAFELWYGNPARHTGYVTRDGITLNLSLDDKNGNSYQLNESGEPVLKKSNQ